MENNINKIDLNDINFRIATTDDITNILAFDSLDTTPLFTKTKLEEEISNDSNYCLVAIYKDNIVGYGSMSIMYDHSDILYISTNKYYKRIGIANSILNLLIDKCKELKLDSIFIEVRKSNIPAISLYTKCDFNKISERINYYTLPTETAIILKRTI